MIEQIIRDREEHGTFRDLKDFLERLSGKEVNKRAVENFIKSGAFDSLKGTRKQFMIIYVQIMDQVAQNKKNSLAGQMSLFDIVDDEQKKNLRSRFRMWENTRRKRCLHLKKKYSACISADIHWKNMKRNGARVFPQRH